MSRIIFNKKRFIFLILCLFFLAGCGSAPPINHPPSITSTPVLNAGVNILYTYDVNATDSDGDLLTYYLVESPAGMTINSTTGLISWTPTPAQEVDTSVVIEVNDGEFVDNQGFVISFQVTDAILTGIVVLPETMYLPIGDSQPISSIVASYDASPDSGIPLNHSGCNYSSDKPGVANVADGIITGISQGLATVTVAYTQGSVTKEDTIEVTVPMSGIIVFPVHNITQNTNYFTIQDALNDAHDGDTIQVKKGTYKESINFPSGKVVILESIDGPTLTFIDGLAGSATVNCNGSQKGTDIRGFNITHKIGTSGVGVYNTNGWIKLTHCNVGGNTSSQPGGGIRNEKATMEIEDSNVSGNSAATSGGGILNDHGTLTIKGNSIVSYNSTDYGGGICNYHGTLTVQGETHIFKNTALRGGGIYNDDGSSTITGGSIVYENEATDRHGGGIFVDRGTVTVAGGSTISENTSNWGGAGIYCFDGVLTVTDSTISENETNDDSGGGIGIFLGELYVTNSTIYKNFARKGAGVFIADANFEITGSTISENSASWNGGGIYLDIGTGISVTIGGSSHTDLANFNTFLNNKKGATISADQHIRDISGDIHGNYPNNKYTPF